MIFMSGYKVLGLGKRNQLFCAVFLSRMSSEDFGFLLQSVLFMTRANSPFCFYIYVMILLCLLYIVEIVN